MDIRQALERLCTQTAPSGFEGPAARMAAELLRPLVDEVSISRSGSVVGVRRCGRPNAKKLLLDAIRPYEEELGRSTGGKHILTQLNEITSTATSPRWSKD